MRAIARQSSSRDGLRPSRFCAGDGAGATIDAEERALSTRFSAGSIDQLVLAQLYESTVISRDGERIGTVIDLVGGLTDLESRTVARIEVPLHDDYEPERARWQGVTTS